MVMWRLMIPVLLAALPAAGQIVVQSSPASITLEVVAVRATNTPPPSVAPPVSAESLPPPSPNNHSESGNSQHLAASQNPPAIKTVPVSQRAPEPTASPNPRVSTPHSEVLRTYDAELESLRPALADLDYDTFKKVSISRLPVTFNEETNIEVTPEYVLHVTPLSVEKNGMVRLNVRLELRSKQEGRPPRNAIATTLATAQNRLFMLRGLKMENGELVVVMKVSR